MKFGKEEAFNTIIRFEWKRTQEPARNTLLLGHSARSIIRPLLATDQGGAAQAVLNQSRKRVGTTATKLLRLGLAKSYRLAAVAISV
jgi:hypothetical protein